MPWEMNRITPLRCRLTVQKMEGMHIVPHIVSPRGPQEYPVLGAKFRASGWPKGPPRRQIIRLGPNSNPISRHFGKLHWQASLFFPLHFLLPFLCFRRFGTSPVHIHKITRLTIMHHPASASCTFVPLVHARTRGVGQQAVS